MSCIFDTPYSQYGLCIWYILQSRWVVLLPIWYYIVYLIHPTVMMCCVFDTSYNQDELCIWYIPQSVWAVYLIHPTVSMNCVFDTSHSQYELCIWYIPQSGWTVFDTSHSQDKLCIWYIPQSVWNVYLIHPTVSMKCVFDTSHSQYVLWIWYIPVSMSCVFDTSHSQDKLYIWYIPQSWLVAYLIPRIPNWGVVNCLSKVLYMYTMYIREDNCRSYFYNFHGSIQTKNNHLSIHYSSIPINSIAFTRQGRCGPILAVCLFHCHTCTVRLIYFL